MVLTLQQKKTGLTIGKETNMAIMKGNDGQGDIYTNGRFELIGSYKAGQFPTTVVAESYDDYVATITYDQTTEVYLIPADTIKSGYTELDWEFYAIAYVDRCADFSEHARERILDVDRNVIQTVTLWMDYVGEDPDLKERARQIFFKQIDISFKKLEDYGHYEIEIPERDIELLESLCERVAEDFEGGDFPALEKLLRYNTLEEIKAYINFYGQRY